MHSWVFLLPTIIVGVAGLLYLGVTVWNAKHDTANAPRDDMYLCSVHGPMPKSATLTLFNEYEFEQEFDDGRTIRGPIRQCPICFETRMKEARVKNP